MKKNSVILIIGLVCFCVMNTFAQSAGVPPTGAPDAASATAEVSASKTSATEAEASKTAQSLPEPDRSAEDFVHVSLCIADPTDQSQDYLGITGHAFLRLQCPYYGLDYCFSYESEKLKGQLWDFMTGRLRMGMFAIPTDEYLEDYRRWQRAVHEYRITMPPVAEQRLWEQMDNHMLKEQDMQMDLVRFGCTNTLLRYVERALLPDTITYAPWPEKYYTQSAAEIAVTHFADYPWTAFFMRLVAEKELRQFTAPKQKVTAPTDLLDVWSRATINGEPLLTYLGDLVEAEPVEVHRPWFTPTVCVVMFGVIIIAIVVIVILRKRK